MTHAFTETSLNIKLTQLILTYVALIHFFCNGLLYYMNMPKYVDLFEWLSGCLIIHAVESPSIHLSFDTRDFSWLIHSTWHSTSQASCPAPLSLPRCFLIVFPSDQPSEASMYFLLIKYSCLAILSLLPNTSPNLTLYSYKSSKTSTEQKDLLLLP